MSCKQVTYRRLGDFITQRREKNDGYDVPIRGVSKEGFIDPKQKDADTSIYNVFYKNDFVFNPARMELNSIALNRDLEKGICSSLYEIFYISDTNKLDPIYLNMLLKHDHFVRFCSFMGWGSVREYFRVNEICEYMIPLIPIEEQRLIVQNVISLETRIENNKRIIAKLEETAQALYRKMFVDGIDVEHLPDGWRMGTLGEVADFAYGKMPNRDDGGDIPIFSGYAITGYTNEYSYDKSHIVVIARGDAGSGKICLSPDKFFLTNLAIAILLKHEAMKYYLYYHLCSLDTSILRSGSAQAQVTINSLLPFEIMIPNICVCEKFNSLVEPMHTQMKIINKENEKLTKLLSMMMAG